MAANGDGGRRWTVSDPPEVETSTRLRAQPGSAARTAGAAGLPAAIAIAPASAASPASDDA
jgi:hypothetical protein